MEHGDITEKIIGCAYTVYNKMGFGFLESIYEKCLMIELQKKGLKANSQEPIGVRYEDIVVGDFVADLIVEDKVIVELKSVCRLAKAHETQLVNYLVATGISIGLLINFGEEKVEVKRKVRDLTNRALGACGRKNPVKPVILCNSQFSGFAGIGRRPEVF